MKLLVLQCVGEWEVYLTYGILAQLGFVCYFISLG